MKEEHWDQCEYVVVIDQSVEFEVEVFRTLQEAQKRLAQWNSPASPGRARVYIQSSNLSP